MKRLIETGWIEYASRVMPANTPPIQILECRRAFYAGAAHLFGALTNEVGPDEISEDAGMAVFEGVQAEIEQHVIDVVRGRR